jgi:hypothetical protein
MLPSRQPSAEAESFPFIGRCFAHLTSLFSLLAGLLDLAPKLILLGALKLVSLLVSKAEAIEIDLSDIESA